MFRLGPLGSRIGFCAAMLFSGLNQASMAQTPPQPSGPPNVPAPALIEGKPLIVRAYVKGSIARPSFSTKSIAVHDFSVALPSDPALLIAVFGEDQTDAAIAARLGSTHWIAKPGLWRLPQPGGALAAGGAFLADALGGPLPVEGLRIEYLFGEPAADINENGLESLWHLSADPIPVDAMGRPLLKPPEGGGERFKGSLISHPDFGTALLMDGEWTAGDSGQRLLALVRADSPAASRALSGQVTTTSGLPVAGALVYPIIARTPGMGESMPFRGAVVADSEGRFRAYPPDTDPRHERGDLYPLGTTVEVGAFAPPAFELFPLQWIYPNTGPARIRMIQGSTIHRFVFMGTEGPFDLNAPGNGIGLAVQLRDQPEPDPKMALRVVKVPASLVRFGGRAPFGKYSVVSSSVAGNWTAFDPVTVDERTSTTVVFRMTSREEVPGRFTGRAINAMTLQPLAGAFVTADPARSNGRLSSLAPADWNALEALSGVFNPSDPSLGGLRNVIYPKNLVRTRADGAWAIDLAPGSRILSFVAFERNFLGTKYRPYPRPGEKRSSALPDFKLWPAAMASFTISIPNRGADTADLILTERWEVDPKSLPEWASDLLPTKRIRDFTFYDEGARLDPRGSSTVQVPAEVPLHLKIVSNAEEYGDWTFPSEILLHQGESVDLGATTIPVNATVAVVVQDENGAPVEGVPLKIIDPESPQTGKIRNTDDQGAAIFFAPPGVKRNVGCQLRDANRRVVETRTIEIEATGKETIPPIFAFKLDRAFLDKAKARQM